MTKQVPDKVAPLASLDTTVSKTDGVFKAKPTAALEVAAVDVTTPLDLKPEFKVTTGAGDAASVTCHYATRKPSDADSPQCYAQSVSCGRFGDRQSFRIAGAEACESGATVYWLVRAENAAGVTTKSGTCAAAGAAPTEWSAKDLAIAPAPVPTSQVCSSLDWKVHYRFLGNRYFGTQQQGGRPVYWYRHLDDPSWGRAYDPELGKVQELTPDWFALMKPVDGDVEGRPLLVALHGRGGGAVSFMGVNFGGTNSTPGDFYAIALDCRENALNDFWWGATVGFILAPYNEYYYSFIGGATMYGELNMGPSLEKFKYHRTACLDWCQRGEPPCMKRVLDTVEWAVRKFKIDRNRIYLCGNSMGGQGALAIGLRHGEVFAAVNANVPATIVYPAAQMGFIDVNGRDVDAASFTAPTYDPPICLDWSGSNDAWSRDHDIMYRNMDRFRFQYLGWWGDYGHCGDYAAARAKNDTLCRTIDWLEVRKDEAYPAFANADSNSALPWPQKGWLAADGSGGKVVGGVETAKGTITPRDGGDLVGQWNGWFRWEVVEDSADALKMRLWIANEDELPSATFKRPTSAQVDVSPRRLQNFRIDGKTVGTWTFDGGQSGKIVYDEKHKVATAPALKLTQTPRLLSFKKAKGE